MNWVEQGGGEASAVARETAAPAAGPRRLPELLAPAGTLDALLAALAAGADAVYTGAGAFNARAAAPDLAMDELALACTAAHAQGARVYVTMNVFLYDGELAPAVELAGRVLKTGADALIVADAGLCLALKDAYPGVELHLSTQAGVHGAPGARLAARELGVARVTCGREISAREMAAMVEHGGGIEVEAFCHGAICICYAGSCSFSALRRGRSANRGDCTQPCRLPYALVDGEGRVLAGEVSFADRGKDGEAARVGRDVAGPGNRLLCPHDYLGIRQVPALVAAGVSALKIEGRMKNPDYVYNVVGCYRRALDAVARGDASEGLFDELEAQLARSFNRGFTDAYPRGASTGAGLMSFERACNQGLFVGEVVERGHEEVAIAFSRAVGAGDTLEIRSTPGEGAPADVPKRWPMIPCPVDARAGECVRMRCKRKVEVGSRVHVVRSRALVEEAARAVEAMRSRAVAAMRARAERAPDARFEPSAYLGVKKGFQVCNGPKTCTAQGCFAQQGHVAQPGHATQPGHVAQQGYVTQPGHAAQQGRVTQPGHAAQSGHAARPGHVTQPGYVAQQGYVTQPCTASASGDPRLRLCKSRPKCDASHAAATLHPPFAQLTGLKAPQMCKPVQKCKPQPAAGCKPQPAVGRAPLPAVGRTPQFAAGPSAAGKPQPAVGRAPLPATQPPIVLDEVCRLSDESRVRERCRSASAVICRNLGEVQVALEEGAAFEVAPPIQVWNARAAAWFAGLGARRIWLPDELPSRAARALIAAVGKVPEVLAPTSAEPSDAPITAGSAHVAAPAAMGRAPVEVMPSDPSAPRELMVTEHCLLTAEGPCDERCATCRRRLEPRYLVEQDGSRLPVRVDEFGRTRIFEPLRLD